MIEEIGTYNRYILEPVPKWILVHKFAKIKAKKENNDYEMEYVRQETITGSQHMYGLKVK